MPSDKAVKREGGFWECGTWVPLWKRMNGRMGEWANERICEYADGRICEYANLRICEFANQPTTTDERLPADG